jgi:hypothetical protein
MTLYKTIKRRNKRAEKLNIKWTEDNPKVHLVTYSDNVLHLWMEGKAFCMQKPKKYPFPVLFGGVETKYMSFCKNCHRKAIKKYGQMFSEKMGLSKG